MKTYILIYQEFAQFEVILTSYFMKTKGEIITVGLDDNKVTSHEGFITEPHITLEEVNSDEVDLFVIPGGDPDRIINNGVLIKLIKEINDKGKIVAAICAAPLTLAKAGILKDKKFTTTLPIEEFKEFGKRLFVDENVVIDQNIITAKASGYVDFAIELGKIMDIYEDDNDLEETVRYFKYFDIAPE